MSNEFPIESMEFCAINQKTLDFGNVNDNTLLGLGLDTNTNENKLTQLKPSDLIGKLITNGDGINIEFNGSKYVISTEYNLQNLMKLEAELKRIANT